MNVLLGSTSSPISSENVLSALTASSTCTFTRVLFSGFMVVCHSCSGFISPSPL